MLRYFKILLFNILECKIFVDMTYITYKNCSFTSFDADSLSRRQSEEVSLWSPAFYLACKVRIRPQSRQNLGHRPCQCYVRSINFRSTSMCRKLMSNSALPSKTSHGWLLCWNYRRTKMRSRENAESGLLLTLHTLHSVESKKKWVLLSNHQGVDGNWMVGRKICLECLCAAQATLSMYVWAW